jgi:hypothetical protein
MMTKAEMSVTPELAKAEYFCNRGILQMASSDLS